MSKVKLVYQQEGRNQDGPDIWQAAFGKSLRQLEGEWLFSLAASHQLDREYVEQFLSATD